MNNAGVDAVVIYLCLSTIVGIHGAQMCYEQCQIWLKGDVSEYMKIYPCFVIQENNLQLSLAPMTAGVHDAM